MTASFTALGMSSVGASSRLLEQIDAGLGDALGRISSTPKQRGKLHQAVGTLLRASGIRAEVGELCQLVDTRTGRETKAEVIGFDGDLVLMSPMGALASAG